VDCNTDEHGNDTMKHPVLNKQKNVFFFFKKQRTRRQNILSGGLVLVEGGEDRRKGCRRVSIVEIYTHL
jgi:hypothetical protein